MHNLLSKTWKDHSWRNKPIFYNYGAPKPFILKLKPKLSQPVIRRYLVLHMLPSRMLLLQRQIRIYNTGLRYITHLAAPLHESRWLSDTAEMFSLLKNLLLTACNHNNQKSLVLFNPKKRHHVEFPKTVFIPRTTCVKMTKDSSKHIFMLRNV